MSDNAKYPVTDKEAGQMNNGAIVGVKIIKNPEKTSGSDSSVPDYIIDKTKEPFIIQNEVYTNLTPENKIKDFNPAIPGNGGFLRKQRKSRRRSDKRANRRSKHHRRH